MSSLREMLDQFVSDGVLTREEHDEFIEAIHADGKIDDEERAQISRMFQLIRDGKLKVVDTERERFTEMKRREAIDRGSAAPAPVVATPTDGETTET